jgi:hypothetical protein
MTAWISAWNRSTCRDAGPKPTCGLRVDHGSEAHADFIAGHRELRDRTGAAIYLGARASAEYPFMPMADGDALEFGHVRLGVLETPGHTPESISIVVYDLARDGSQPHAVLTGDRPSNRTHRGLGWIRISARLL